MILDSKNNGSFSFLGMKLDRVDRIKLKFQFVANSGDRYSKGKLDIETIEGLHGAGKVKDDKSPCYWVNLLLS